MIPLAQGLLIAAALSGTGPIHVLLRDTLTLDRPGATAAFAVDSTVAEASASRGRITIRGTGVGTTEITVVAGRDAETFTLVVDQPPRRTFAAADSARGGWTLFESSYDSGVR